MGLQNPSHETKCSGANADWEIIIFPVIFPSECFQHQPKLTLSFKMEQYCSDV